MFLASGSLVGGLAGGYIAGQLGWAYIFWIDVALAAGCFLGIFFFVPETLYLRSDASPSTERLEQPGSKEAGSQPTYRPLSFARSLGFRKPVGRVAHHFFNPWAVLRLPGTWVVTLQYGGLVGGIVTISTIGPQLLAMPPYLWGNNVGLLNVGGLIGTLLGALYTYFTSDARLKSAAKHDANHLIEPEARLPTMLPGLAVATIGFLVFGFCAQYPGPNVWAGLQVGHAMVAFGLMQAPSIGFNYVSSPAFRTPVVGPFQITNLCS